MTDAVGGPLVALRGVFCAYGGEDVLADIDLSIGPEAFLGVLGPSGSGKSTLLGVLIGLHRPVAGVVERRPGLRIGYVPQVERVDWDFPVTVSECVLMARVAGAAPGRARWYPWASRSERVEVAEVLDRLGLDGLGGRHIRELSGGQQQRVFVARALLGRPDLLVLDEPTSGVDVATRHEVLHLLADLHRDGLAIVLSTHDLNGMAAHLPQVVCLQRRILGSGPPREVLTAEVLEQTYGAPMVILEHAGLPFVVDDHRHIWSHEAPR